MPLSIGQILDHRYRIVKLLGQGGFGAVYRAWDMRLNGPCAVKESFESSPAAQRQFEREASLLFNLRHPNLPRVFDSFVTPGQGMYLVMDYIEGQNLQEILDATGRPLPEAQVLSWIAQVCDALSYLHSQQPPVVHRDLKPDNIRIAPTGQVMLVDFGIAKLYDPNLRTTAGARAVTPGYSPPEQYGQGSTDVRSDIYALGATLYALLTGRIPADSVDVMTGNQPPPASAQTLKPYVSLKVSRAIDRAMRLDRKDRWPSVIEFKAALGMTNVQGRAVTSTARAPAPQTIGRSALPASSAPAASTVRSLPWGWIGAAGLIVFGVALFLGSWLGGMGGKSIPTATHTAVVSLTQTLPPATDIVTMLAQTLIPSPTGFPESPGERGAPMALIPAGETQLGSEDGNIDEQPVYTANLEAYTIDIYEVTNARYAECVAAGSCRPPRDTGSATHSNYYGSPDFGDYPVINVTWDMAQEYCEWRGAQLPTEAQWEKAARGGLEQAQFSWGDESSGCSRTNYWGKSGGCIGDTNSVGSYPPNGYGLYDMAGNVWEWVQDWYRGSNYNTVSPEGSSAVGQYMGEFTDTDGDGYHEFSPGDEMQGFTPSGSVTIMLSWDAWEEGQQDYDLVVLDADAHTVTSSENVQDTPDASAYERVSYAFPDSGPYYIAIKARKITRISTLNVLVLFGGTKDPKLEHNIEPGAETLKALRGGAWNLGDWYIRNAGRGWFIPSSYNASIGFRCVQTP